MDVSSHRLWVDRIDRDCHKAADTWLTRISGAIARTSVTMAYFQHHFIRQSNSIHVPSKHPCVGGDGCVCESRKSKWNARVGRDASHRWMKECVRASCANHVGAEFVKSYFYATTGSNVLLLLNARIWCPFSSGLIRRWFKIGCNQWQRLSPYIKPIHSSDGCRRLYKSRILHRMSVQCENMSHWVSSFAGAAPRSVCSFIFHVSGLLLICHAGLVSSHVDGIDSSGSHIESGWTISAKKSVKFLQIADGIQCLWPHLWWLRKLWESGANRFVAKVIFIAVRFVTVLCALKLRRLMFFVFVSFRSSADRFDYGDSGEENNVMKLLNDVSTTVEEKRGRSQAGCDCQLRVR